MPGHFWATLFAILVCPKMSIAATSLEELAVWLLPTSLLPDEERELRFFFFFFFFTNFLARFMNLLLFFGSGSRPLSPKITARSLPDFLFLSPPLCDLLLLSVLSFPFFFELSFLSFFFRSWPSDRGGLSPPP